MFSFPGMKRREEKRKGWHHGLSVVSQRKHERKGEKRRIQKEPDDRGVGKHTFTSSPLHLPCLVLFWLLPTPAPSSCPLLSLIACFGFLPLAQNVLSAFHFCKLQHGCVCLYWLLSMSSVLVWIFRYHGCCGFDHSVAGPSLAWTSRVFFCCTQNATH